MNRVENTFYVPVIWIHSDRSSPINAAISSVECDPFKVHGALMASTILSFDCSLLPKRMVPKSTHRTAIPWIAISRKNSSIDFERSPGHRSHVLPARFSAGNRPNWISLIWKVRHPKVRPRFGPRVWCVRLVCLFVVLPKWLHAGSHGVCLSFGVPYPFPVFARCAWLPPKRLGWIVCVWWVMDLIPNSATRLPFVCEATWYQRAA